MLSIGWPEMMVVAAAALIIVGPRDLPTLLRNIGRVVSKARRMGDEFRAEINKVAALDDMKDIKKSITTPLKETRADIESEFNKITPDGVKPTGAIAPADPGAESVYDEIKAAASPKKSMSEAVARATAKSAAEKPGAPAKTPTKTTKRQSTATKQSKKAKSTGATRAKAKPATTRPAKSAKPRTAAAKTKTPAKRAAKSTKSSTG